MGTTVRDSERGRASSAASRSPRIAARSGEMLSVAWTDTTSWSEVPSDCSICQPESLMSLPRTATCVTKARCTRLRNRVRRTESAVSTPRARVTQTKLDYPGSIAVDSDLLKAVGIRPYESVLMANVTNGQRAETYVVEAAAGAGEVVILGAAARLFNPKDIIILINFGFYTPDEIQKHKPKVIALDKNNKIIKTLS